MTHTLKGGKSLRIDRRFKGAGRIALVTGTRDRKLFDAFDRMLTELHEEGRLEVLRAIKDRFYSIQQVYEARRNNRLGSLATDIKLQEPLWEAVEEWLPKSARAQSSRERYKVSLQSLRRSGVLSDSATVADLRDVDWRSLSQRWWASPADWNRLRAAVSRFLTMLLRDKWHPFRRQLMQDFPKLVEPEGRVPDLPPEVFWRIVNTIREEIRPAYICLAATGMRIGEYLRCREENLLPHSTSVTVPSSKGPEAVIRVGPDAWEWVRRAIPAPRQYKALYRSWKDACSAAGNPDLTIHDLRHCYGQWLVDAGQPESKVQHSMRHKDPSMTRRYTRQKDRGENAQMMDVIMFPEGSKRLGRTG